MTFQKLIILFSLAGLVLSGCKKDDPQPNQQEKSLDQLTSIWKLSEVTVNGSTAPGDYSAFELTLAGSLSDASYAYVAKGRPDRSPWPSGGTWIFGNDVAAQIIRDPNTVDELPMTYTVINNVLTIEFVFQGTGYQTGRINTIDGDWSFVFTQK